MESFVRHHSANVVNYITRKSGIRPTGSCWRADI
ncbi:hypothetical protein CNBG_10064 [Cryptococcus deuterogattii R265]|nr:hypothetical protein CNBG_10064 [Cryptococcus deuterogattii R265]